MSDIKLSEIIPPHFHGLHRAVREHEVSEYVLPGGRGSCKSSFVSEEIPLLIKRNPNMHALVLRKYGNTLKDSVFNQILWAIETLGLSAEFKVTVSPMQITYIPTGQIIFFRGLDDPLKVKSIKPKFGYIGILWFEELDQFSGSEEIRSVEQSAERGGDRYWVFKSFNPPMTRSNWANKYVEEAKDDRIVLRSDYRSVPAEWLGQRFIDEAEHLKATNPRAYEHEYLGVATGTGGNVFENVKSQRITDEDIKTFGTILHGVDWGWYPDPYQYVRCAYDAAHLRLYIYREYRANKQSNRQTADKLIEMGVTEWDIITCDSAEKKSVGDYRSYGLGARAAEKGPGSVDYSMKWLQSLNEIIIDPEECPNVLKEFMNYEYERSKNGDIISGYPDRDNHAIDAVRYATETIWKKKGR